MKPVVKILLLCQIVAAPVGANQEAIVVREAIVYAKASSVSTRVGKLEAGTRVSLFSRQGGWKEVFSDDKAVTGWVRSHQVREGDYAPKVETETKSDSRGFLAGLASLSRKASGFFRSSSKPTSSSTATIGVRGLSEEDIKSAQADFDELEKLKGFASNGKGASSFARKGKLRAQKVAHISGPKKK